MVYDDDFSKYPHVDFLREKHDTFIVYTYFVVKLQVEYNGKTESNLRIQSNHLKEFENLKHEFSTLKTPLITLVRTWVC